jgi:NitT/TauT family transport system substrate-binding protein
LVFALFLSSFLLSSCTSHEESKKSDKIRLSALNGPTALGLLDLVQNDKYLLTVDGSQDVLLANFSRGDIDIATVPSNTAAALYNKAKNLQILDINTFSPLYIVGDDKIKGENDVQTWQNISQTQICVSGKGSIPNMVLNYLTETFKVKSVLEKIDWQSSPATCIQKQLANRKITALLPEPYAASAVKQLGQAAKLINIGQEFSQFTGVNIITGVTIASQNFINEYPGSVKQFLQDHKDSIQKFKSNPQSFQSSMERYAVYGKDVVNEAAQDINIAFSDGQDAQIKLTAFYAWVEKNQPKLIGQTAPDKAIYYIGN